MKPRLKREAVDQSNGDIRRFVELVKTYIARGFSPKDAGTAARHDLGRSQPTDQIEAPDQDAQDTRAFEGPPKDTP